MQIKLNEKGMRKTLNEVGAEGLYVLSFVSSQMWDYYDDEGNLINSSNEFPSLEDIQEIYADEEGRNALIEFLIESLKNSQMDIH